VCELLLSVFVLSCFSGTDGLHRQGSATRKGGIPSTTLPPLPLPFAVDGEDGDDDACRQLKIHSLLCYRRNR